MLTLQAQKIQLYHMKGCESCQIHCLKLQMVRNLKKTKGTKREKNIFLGEPSQTPGDVKITSLMSINSANTM